MKKILALEVKSGGRCGEENFRVKVPKVSSAGRKGRRKSKNTLESANQDGRDIW